MEVEFGRAGNCLICNSPEHMARKCPKKDSLKEKGINCGHCGSLAANLNHHPDICRDRFSYCRLCGMKGHGEAVHRNPVSLRIAARRLGSHGLPYNKIDPVWDIPSNGSGQNIDINKDKG